MKEEGRAGGTKRNEGGKKMVPGARLRLARCGAGAKLTRTP